VRTPSGTGTDRWSFRLGDWLVEPRGGKAIRAGREVRLRPRIVDLLVYLAGRPGEVVSKEELLDAIWSTRFVAESALSGAVAELRSALEDDPASPWLIETIPKRGYRLIAIPLPEPSSAIGGPRAPAPAAPWAEGPDALFVDRERELSLLLRSHAQALSGRGRVVFVTGEAGSGKTALLVELGRRLLAGGGGTAVAGGKGHSPRGASDAYLPFREALHVLSGDPDGGWLPSALRAWSARAVHEWAQDLAAVVPTEGPDLPGTLLPGPPRSPPPTRLALVDQVSRTLRAFSARRPLVLLLDDFHWADESSIGLLFHLGRHLPGSRILVVATYRPEDLRRSGGTARHILERVVEELVRYSGEAPVQLSPRADRAFVDALVDAVPNRLGEEFREALFRHTSGQPLQTIEVLRSLQAGGALVLDGEGFLTAEEGIDWRRLPTRVEFLVREWLHGAGRSAQSILEAAAVEGEEFAAETVALALGLPASRVISTLSVEAGPVRCLAEPLGVKVVHGRRASLYRFRSRLAQRFLLDGLDPAERAARHEATGDALEAFFGGATAGVDLVLAHHFEAGASPERAAPYRVSAGDRAMALCAPAEALQNYAAAAGLLGERTGPTPESDALLLRAEAGRALALSLGHGYASPEAGEAWRRVRAVCLAAGDERGLFRALLQLGHNHGARGELRQALELAREILRTAERGPSRGDRMLALFHLGIALSQAGDLPGALSSFARAEALQARDGGAPVELLYGHDPFVAASAFWALALLEHGLPEQSMARATSTLTLAERRAHPYGLALAHGLGMGLVLLVRRESVAALAHARETVATAESHGFPDLLALGEFLIGSALAERNELGEGIRRMQRGLDLQAASGHCSCRTILLCRLAEALVSDGRAAEGLESAAQALALAESSGEASHLPEARRVHAEALEAAGDGGGRAAEQLLGALQAARDCGALLFELRAALSLQRVERRLARGNEGHAAVAAAFAKFGEGFELPDLREARRILETPYSPRA
jgi:DNA-binding winged helix-turn-helix (wHTH) protein/predicted ATPase